MSSLWDICVPLPLDYPTCKFKNRWRCVDSHFVTWFRSYRKHFCPESPPIVWYWVNVAAQPLHFPRCNARSHWRSVDAYFENVVAMILQRISRRKAANSWMIVQCRHAALAFSIMQGQKLLTLCWRSYLGHSPNVVATMVCVERRAIVRLWVKDVAKPSQISKMHWQKLFTLRWRSFLGGSRDIFCCVFTYKGRQNYDYG